ncbi:DUF1905 domain-containing protein [Deinococcus aestuarii]|uniref:DUF1905 domain-containing protein n=1 Tax=Deinococcus aestuarii TaxID=2774531 RepID=UPI001C0D18C9|nr:DUF1905 domain-containing protein [Deinococcus aestuarii]
MNLEFSGELWHWAGPAPWYFVAVPVRECRVLQTASKFVTYGWGMIPAQVRIGETEYRTSLFPKEGRYLVPVKASVRRAERLEEGAEVRVCLRVGV